MVLTRGERGQAHSPFAAHTSVCVCAVCRVVREMEYALHRGVFLAIVFGILSARNGFVKDQSTSRIKFPPAVPPRKPYSAIPIGHMRPLGKHWIKVTRRKYPYRLM